MVVITELYRLLFGKSKLLAGNVIDMAEHGRSGGLSTGQPFKFTDGLDYAVKITESGEYTYIGWANPGTTEATAAWKCMRLDSAAGLRIEWADGNQSFDNTASDLTSLTYS